MIKFIKNIALFKRLRIALYNTIHPPIQFKNSKQYWTSRYQKGGNSGAGSYNRLAEFKAEIINNFVLKENINTVIELGSGDGNQLDYFSLPSYIGFDISPLIIEKCKEKYKADPSKQFMLMGDISNQKAELTLSLDVIYHLIEEEVFTQYMNHLFDLSTRYVIIYSINANEFDHQGPHVKPRKFTDWVGRHKPEFILKEFIPNRFPFDKEKEESTSFADFFIFERT